MSAAGGEEFRGTERFALERRLGSGGFGVVYKVFDRRRGAIVALKTLRRADEEALYRLKREFRALADISHPNLVSLYELLSEQGRWFFTMEYVKGLDFLGWSLGAVPGSETPPPRTDRTRTLTGEPPPYPPTVPLRDRADIPRLRTALRQAAAGVRALHEAGHLHCDIKPSNVLVTDEGRVVLLDFGLVRETVHEEGEISLAIAGTPTYMAPEQGANRPVTEASDWYSLGVMLYEALTGRPPFTGSYAEIMIEKLRSDPAPVSQVAPGVPEDLDRLCQALLTRDPALRPTGADVVAMLGADAGVAARVAASRRETRASSPPLVGRDRHLAALEDAFRIAERGHAAAVFVHGGSGMGKSSLVRRFLEDLRARGAALTLAGRCYERESVPYKAVDSLIDALSHHWKRLPSAEAEALLPRDVGALARVFPILRRVEAVASARGRAPEAPDAHELRRRAFAALRDLFGRLAERRPVVLFIDDLQWGDLDSAALLRELLRPPDPPAVLLIAAYRTEDATGSPPISRLLAARREGLETRELLVSELAEAEATALARRLLPETGAERAEAIVRESAGNPFLIDELARYERGGSPEMPQEKDPTPASLFSRLVATRLAALPDTARRLLEIVAVAGAPVDAAVAAEAAGLESAEAEIAALRSGHLLRRRAAGADGEQLEAYHDRIRESVAAQLSGERRNECHRSLAAALEARRDADPEALAQHYLEGGDAARAAGYAAAAANRASEALAFDRAARLYGLALRLEPSGPLEERRRLRLSLAEALANAGRGAEAAEAYLEAVPGASAAEALELQRRAAEQMLRSGHIDRGLPLLKGILGRINLRLMESPKAALASLLLRRAMVRLRGMRFVERDESQVSEERLIRIDTCWSVSIGLAMVDTFRSRDFQARHLLLALDTGERFRVARAFANEAGFSATAGRAASARTERILRRAVSLADRVNHPQALAIAQVALGITAYLEGRWRVAWERAQNAEAILRDRCTGVAWELDTTHIYSMRALAYLGGLRELQRRLPALLAEAAERDDLFAETSLRARHLYVARLAEDRPEEALREVREAISRWSHEGFHLQHYFALFSEMDLAIYRGAPEAARAALARDEEALAGSRLRRLQVFRVELAFVDGRAALLSAEKAAAGRLEEAERAAALLTRENLPWANPLAALLRAGIAARRDQPEEALERLLQAEVAFEEADMALYAAAARRTRGRLLGGDGGKALVDAADDAMRAERIVDPERFARYLAPMPE
ncbi:MAG TPA: protein kinase [Thermoanaerobaculia bacterium]